MSRHSYTEEEFTEAWSTSLSIAECARKLGLKAAGGNYLTLKNRAKQLGLSRDHMTGSGHNKDKTRPPRRSLEEILVYGRIENTAMVKRRMLTEGYFQPKCYGCGLEEWRGNPIPLELDHVNGDRYDNREANLILLCPNCHALTPTYRGRNIGVRRKAPKESESGGEGSPGKPGERKSRSCVGCGIGVSSKATRCKRCAGVESSRSRGRVIEWPPLEEILTRLETVSYTALARELGVSDNAIRKFIGRGGR